MHDKPQSEQVGKEGGVLVDRKRESGRACLKNANGQRSRGWTSFWRGNSKVRASISLMTEKPGGNHERGLAQPVGLGAMSLLEETEDLGPIFPQGRSGKREKAGELVYDAKK